MDHLPFILSFLLIGGIVHPKYAMWAGYLHIVGRIFYLLGYSKLGPKWRLPGNYLAGLPIYALGIANAVSLFKYLM